MCFISSALLFAWEFFRLHPGTVAVFLGVVGEIILLWSGKEEEFKKTKKLCWTLIVLGLAVELAETAESDREVADINSTNKVLQLRIEELRQQNNIVETKLENSIKARLFVEAVLLPRQYVDKVESAKRLKQFAGTKYAIVSTPNDPEHEASDLAVEISLVLKDAGWIRSVTDTNRFLNPFNVDEPNRAMFDGVRIETEPTEGPYAAAKALAGELHQSNIIASPAAGKNLGDLLVIKVGKKPGLSTTKMQLITQEITESTNHAQTKALFDKLWDASY